jgi:hypothetical protein
MRKDKAGWGKIIRIFWEVTMKQTKVTHRTARPAGVVRHGLLAGLMLAAILVADPAMAARRGKGGLPPELLPANPAASAAQQAAVTQPGAKPILRHGRHASKPRAGAR